MQRLIDADRLERKAKFNQQVGNFIKLSDLKTAPTIDAEPVVRCKDCKYLLKNNMLCLHKRNRVFNTGLNVYENHYCSYGAKMDEEQECET